MSRKVMVIGIGKSGKTALVDAINQVERKPRKTQDMIFGKYTIDVPGSYLENPWMYKHLISAAQNNAGHVLILVDQSNPVEKYSPGFARVFRCPVTDVITKCDLKPENEEICRKQLMSIGVNEPIFKVSVETGEGIEELREYVLKDIIERS
jgi:ethanolamine utilization protein EutP